MLRSLPGRPAPARALEPGRASAAASGRFTPAGPARRHVTRNTARGPSCVSSPAHIQRVQMPPGPRATPQRLSRWLGLLQSVGLWLVAETPRAAAPNPWGRCRPAGCSEPLGEVPGDDLPNSIRRKSGLRDRVQDYETASLRGTGWIAQSKRSASRSEATQRQTSQRT